jgi:cytidine deaminase
MKDFKIIENFDELDTESKYLSHKAKDACNHAHAPYSRFHVGAAAVLEDGTVVTGSNYENAAYPSGMCAERVTIYAAAAQYPDKKIVKLVVVAKKKGGKDLLPATSCGACRQAILEVEHAQQKQIQIVMQDHKNQWVVAPSAASLLPFSFSNENLKHT